MNKTESALNSVKDHISPENLKRANQLLDAYIGLVDCECAVKENVHNIFYSKPNDPKQEITDQKKRAELLSGYLPFYKYYEILDKEKMDLASKIKKLLNVTTIKKAYSKVMKLNQKLEGKIPYVH